MLLNFTAMTDAEMEKRLKTEIDQFFFERRRRAKWKTPVKEASTKSTR